MAAGKFTYLSYRRHRICNPFSFDTLGRVLAYADLRPGERAYDLGSGNGVVAAWMAQRFGLDMTAVERFSLVADLARETASGVTGPGRMTVAEDSAAPFLESAPPCRLLSAIGTVNLLPDAREPAEVFAALARFIEPGGWLLWGDPFWKKPPSPVLQQVFVNERYQTLPGYITAGEQAGLVPIAAHVGTEQDWDDYAWLMNASVEDWLAENPDDPEAPAFRAQITMMRRLYVEEVRESMGFGLYLFRRPA